MPGYIMLMMGLVGGCNSNNYAWLYNANDGTCWWLGNTFQLFRAAPSRCIILVMYWALIPQRSHGWFPSSMVNHKMDYVYIYKLNNLGLAHLASHFEVR